MTEGDETSDELCGQSDVDTESEDWETRDVLYQEDPDARYFYNKIETARFFTYNVLPKNKGIIATIDSEDRSALTFVL